MSHKASLACAGAIAAAATFAGIGPALSHTIVGNRVFPATLAIDDPGVNDELGCFRLSPISQIRTTRTSSTSTSNVQKTITADLWFSIGDTFTHLTNTVKPDGTIGTLNGWSNIETQLKYQLYVRTPEHEFIVSIAVSVEWGHTGDVGIGFADPFTSIHRKRLRRQGLWRCGGRVGEAHRGDRRGGLYMVDPSDRLSLASINLATLCSTRRPPF